MRNEMKESAPKSYADENRWSLSSVAIDSKRWNFYYIEMVKPSLIWKHYACGLM